MYPCRSLCEDILCHLGVEGGGGGGGGWAVDMFVHVAVMSFEPISQIPLELFSASFFIFSFSIIFIHMPLPLPLDKHLSSIFRFGFPFYFSLILLLLLFSRFWQFVYSMENAMMCYDSEVERERGGGDRERGRLSARYQAYHIMLGGLCLSLSLSSQPKLAN